MRTIILLVVATAVLGGLVAGQHYQNGWVVTGDKHLHYVAPNGSVTSISYSTNSNAEIAIMNWDNQTALVPDFSKQAILKIDPGTLTVIGTFVQNSMFGHVRTFQEAEFDSNGDLYFAASWPIQGVFKFARGAMNFTTVFNNPSTAQPLYWINNMSIDIDSGELIVGDDNHLNDDVLYLMRRGDGSFTRIGKMGGPWAFRQGSYKHIPTGDIYCGTAVAGNPVLQSILVLRSGTSVATVFLNHPTLKEASAPMPDRASAAVQQLVTASKLNQGDGVWKVDIATQAATKIATIQRNCFKCVPAFGRNVQTISTGKGKWDARVSLPMWANRSFLLAVSMSGVRPGMKLPDGRTIPLIMDNLAFLSVTLGLAPFVTGNVGTLDRTGLAVAKIDVSGIGKVLNGIRLWLCAVVIDGSAPLGIGVITDPKCLVLEGM